MFAFLLLALAMLLAENASGPLRLLQSMPLASRPPVGGATRRAMVKGTRHCFACGKREYSISWHGHDNVQWCHKAHLRYIRNQIDKEPLHPSWSSVRSHIHDVDNTGCLIFSADCRQDVQSMKSCGAVLAASEQWNSTVNMCFVCGFAHHMYWPWTMMQVVLSFLPMSPSKLTSVNLRHVMLEVKKTFAGLKVQNGVLVHNCTTGLDPFKNPMERQSGFVKFESLLDELKQWKQCSEALALVIDASEQVKLGDLLTVLRTSSLNTYQGRADYGNIRLCRALVFMNGKQFCDSISEWHLLCNQSLHLRQVTKQLGLSHFKVAMEFLLGLQALLARSNYCLNDFATFLCLAYAGHS